MRVCISMWLGVTYVCTCIHTCLSWWYRNTNLCYFLGTIYILLETRSLIALELGLQESIHLTVTGIPHVTEIPHVTRIPHVTGILHVTGIPHMTGIPHVHRHILLFMAASGYPNSGPHLQGQCPTNWVISPAIKHNLLPTNMEWKN